MSGKGWRQTHTQTDTHTHTHTDTHTHTHTNTDREETKKGSFWGTVRKLWMPFILDTWRAPLTGAVFNLKWTMEEHAKHLMQAVFGGELFVIYLKIEQAHSGFHKGDQANGFCQCVSFQVVLKPVNKLNTQGQSHAQLINNTHCFCEWKTINPPPK